MAFLERVEHYVNKRPMWTPAEGALLVNGVMPPPKGCTDIPDDAAQLEDLVQLATQSQLLGARMLLHAYRKDVDNGDASQAERITSDGFLEWCKDGDFLPAWTLKLAEFLRHLYFPGSAHNPFPRSVEDEVTALRKEIAVDVFKRQLDSEKPPAHGDETQRPPLLRTHEVIEVFRGHFGSVHPSKKRIGNWEAIFKKPPKTLLPSKKDSRQGVEATWDPIDIGVWLHDVRGYAWSSLNRAFKASAQLQPWWPHWGKATKFRGNDDVDA